MKQIYLLGLLLLHLKGWIAVVGAQGDANPTQDMAAEVAPQLKTTAEQQLGGRFVKLGPGQTVGQAMQGGDAGARRHRRRNDRQRGPIGIAASINRHHFIKITRVSIVSACTRSCNPCRLGAGTAVAWAGAWTSLPAVFLVCSCPAASLCSV